MRCYDVGEGVSVELLDEQSPYRLETVYPDGIRTPGERADDYDNRQEAADEGYSNVLRCFVEHEILHTLVARKVFGRESHVLREVGGAGRERYALRLHEEALVISFQTKLNTGQEDSVLNGVDLSGVEENLRTILAQHDPI